jgi:hypothetical protein
MDIRRNNCIREQAEEDKADIPQTLAAARGVFPLSIAPSLPRLCPRPSPLSVSLPARMVKKVGKYELGRSLGEGTFGK